MKNMIQEKKYKYKFSIVTAIYNVEPYIEEAILSVINQDIGFEENVQLILVNDGSPDNSHEICQKYADMYPNNIVYIKKENGGVSSARNEGMKYIEGKYMNFLDGDDKLEINALSVVNAFYEEVYDYVDVVSIPVFFFEARSGGHLLNYKYNKTRQINLLREYTNIQLFINSTFIKSEFKDKFQFSLDMKYAEDAEFVNKIMLEKCTLGVVRSTKYLYRIRQDESSAIQTGTKRKEWYLDYLDTFSLRLLEYAKKEKGYIPNFIQYMIMYDLQWRFRLEEITAGVLTEEEVEIYKQKLSAVLNYIDDDIILSQKSISSSHKMHILKMKYGERLNDHLEKICSPNNIAVMYKDKYLCSPHNENVRIDFIDVEQGVLKVEGAIGRVIPDETYEVQVELGGKVYETIKVDRANNNQKSLGDVIKEMQGFKVEIPLDANIKEQYLKIYIQVGDIRIRPNMTLGKFVRICRELEDAYFITDTHRVVFKHNAFIILSNSLKVNLGREYRLMKSLAKKKQHKIMGIRLAYFVQSLFKRKEVWLLMDRTDKADDNAEHLFKYLNANDHTAKKYFVLKEDSPDFERMKQYGEVVGFNTMKHKWLLLCADKVISSHIEDNIRVPFQGDGKYLKDLANFKFVFLQHGIIKHNLAPWLNKYNKNIDILVTSAYQEYQSIKEDGYGYDESVVKLTGLPRYDNLQNKTKRQVLIMPTWRGNLVKNLDQTKGVRPYNDKFKESDYFHTYNNLINNKELIEAAKKNNYQLVFFPHPATYQQVGDFDKNEYVKILPYDTSYQEMFNESALMITDYSSVAFDFAYLKKPVIYYQFDRETFFNGQVYTEGYFNDETMGFGPICKNQESVVKQIISYMENDCKLEAVYKERIEKFYKYTDTNNCQRVYEEMKKL